MSRFLPLKQWRYLSSRFCKKLQRHHQIFNFNSFIHLLIKKPALLGAGSIFNILLKIPIWLLTPNLRKKTPPRKPYCICFLHHFISNSIQKNKNFYLKTTLANKSLSNNNFLVGQCEPETHSNICI
jgi:hypothetical protein